MAGSARGWAPWAWVAALVPSIAAAGFEPAAPRPGDDGWTVEAGEYRLDIGAPDDPAHPRLWEADPLVVRHAGSCRVDGLGPLAAVHVDVPGGRVLVTSVSGSYTLLTTVRLADCAVLDRRSAFTAGVRVEGDEVVTAAACECGDDRTRCMCHAAQIVSVTPEGRLVDRPDDPRVARLTREALGIGFSGRALVDNPYTPAARIVAPLH
ncbi:hypothetical protein [Azospirillum argentinense]